MGLSGTLIVACAVTAVLALVDQQLGTNLVFGGLAGGCAAAAIFATRGLAASVIITPSHVRVRGIWRTRWLPRERILDVRATSLSRHPVAVLQVQDRRLPIVAMGATPDDFHVRGIP